MIKIEMENEMEFLEEDLVKLGTDYESNYELAQALRKWVKKNWTNEKAGLRNLGKRLMEITDPGLEGLP